MESEIANRLAYDALTGQLTWLASGGRATAGKMAGSRRHTDGYVCVCVSGRMFYGHRIAWLLTYGNWPSKSLDHINGNRADNRIANLREVTASENAQNQSRAQRGSASGALGVYPCRQRWLAIITKQGVRHRIGTFPTIQEASAAYQAAKSALHIGGSP